MLKASGCGRRGPRGEGEGAARCAALVISHPTFPKRVERESGQRLAMVWPRSGSGLDLVPLPAHFQTVARRYPDRVQTEASSAFRSGIGLEAVWERYGSGLDIVWSIRPYPDACQTLSSRSVSYGRLAGIRGGSHPALLIARTPTRTDYPHPHTPRGASARL